MSGSIQLPSQSWPDRNEQLRAQLLELARREPRYGYGRLHVLLHRRGYEIDVKRIHRLYTEAGRIV